MQDRYTFTTFLWDLFLLLITGGVWLVGIYCREMRRPWGRYSAFNFLVDVLMIIVTLGFWIIWVFCRELRSR